MTNNSIFISVPTFATKNQNNAGHILKLFCSILYLSFIFSLSSHFSGRKVVYSSKKYNYLPFCMMFCQRHGTAHCRDLNRSPKELYISMCAIHWIWWWTSHPAKCNTNQNMMVLPCAIHIRIWWTSGPATCNTYQNMINFRPCHVQ